MSDEEENNYCYFGKPLDPYDDDSFPSKKPIGIEDQIATDAQGRRRFHGAFTGGFSAGFFNTVGSLEGWTPSEFKSTRQEKAKSLLQKPEDFMDQEDLEEHGIAPQTVRATKEYSTSNKRKRQVFSDGPIPGIPVLETLLTSGNETIGYLLLKKIGIKEKIRKQHEMTSDLKMYSCQMPDKFQISEHTENKQYKIPEIYTENLGKSKSNTFGLGYKGLERSHVNLFTESGLVMTDSKNKKMSISGQAFGVGAFEEEDEDIYSKEDMSNYDFETGKEKQNQVPKGESILYLGLFKPSKVPLNMKKIYPIPTIPHSFTGKHKIRKSRFEPVDIKMEKQEIDRKIINPIIRARYLGEEPVAHTSQPIIETNQIETQTLHPRSFDIASLMVNKFVSASSNDDNTKLEVKRESDHGTNDMREAAKMNMFGPLTRVTFDWTPVAILCKRFNVPEPLIDRPEQKNRKRTKNLIFESQKYSDEDKSLFKPECSTDLTTNEPQPSTSQIVNDANEEHTNIKMEIISPEEEKEIHFSSGVQDINIDLNEETKDITEKIGIEEKIDLFKAVFMSSSESDDGDDDDEAKEETETDKQTDEFKETILSDLVPKIKPLKEGILSNLNFQSTQVYHGNQNIENHSEKPITFIPKKDRNSNANNDDSQSKLLSYGPQLPSQKFESSKDKLKTNTISFIDSDDEWVEKDNESVKSKHKKKRKKSKKHKHSKKDK